MFLSVLTITDFGTKVVVNLLHAGGELSGGDTDEEINAGVKPLVATNGEALVVSET